VPGFFASATMGGNAAVLAVLDTGPAGIGTGATRAMAAMNF
jgi:hypothetical protein